MTILIYLLKISHGVYECLRVNFKLSSINMKRKKKTCSQTGKSLKFTMAVFQNQVNTYISVIEACK